MAEATVTATYNEREKRILIRNIRIHFEGNCELSVLNRNGEEYKGFVNCKLYGDSNVKKTDYEIDATCKKSSNDIEDCLTDAEKKRWSSIAILTQIKDKPFNTVPNDISNIVINFIDSSDCLKEVFLFDINEVLDKRISWDMEYVKIRIDSGETEQPSFKRLCCGRRNDNKTGDDADVISISKDTTELEKSAAGDGSGHNFNQNKTDYDIAEDVFTVVGIYIGKSRCGTTCCLNTCPDDSVTDTWVDQYYTTHTTVPTMVLEKNGDATAFGYQARNAFKQAVGESVTLMPYASIVQNDSFLKYILRKLKSNVEVQLKQSELRNSSSRTQLIVAHATAGDTTKLQKIIKEVFDQEPSLIHEIHALWWWFNRLISDSVDPKDKVYGVYDFESDFVAIVKKDQPIECERSLLDLDSVFKKLLVDIFNQKDVEHYMENNPLDWFTMQEMLKIQIHGLKNDKKSKVVVTLQFTFCKYFKDITSNVVMFNQTNKDCHEQMVKFKKNDLLEIRSEYFVGIFNSASKKILDFINRTGNTKIDYLFLIGGATFLQSPIELCISEKEYQVKISKIIGPLDQNTCALKGAVLFMKESN